MNFPNTPSPSISSAIRRSLDVVNYSAANGGEDALSLNELKQRIPNQRNSQSRIVTKEDLLSRVYTMPSDFGRVFRAGVRPNPNNPLASQLFIISRDKNKKLVISPDSLKRNLTKYLNQYRLVSDAIDILDASVVNYQVRFKISSHPQANKSQIIQNVIARLSSYLRIENFQIDQPLVISDIRNLIFNTDGVLSVIDIKIENLVGNYRGRQYSDVKNDVVLNTFDDMYFPSEGGILELKYPKYDIIGSSI
jgi:hypothetical protein